MISSAAHRYLVLAVAVIVGHVMISYSSLIQRLVVGIPHMWDQYTAVSLRVEHAGGGY
jgi:hypothetical protein